jgi:hypothetical protein
VIAFESIGTELPTVAGVLDGGTVRLVGGAAIAAVILGMLYVVVRYGESRRDGVDDDDASSPPSMGPAYGAGGSTIEEALTGERMDDGLPEEQPSGGDDGDPEEPRGPPEVLSHRVVSRRGGELVVEVTDGDTTGRFYVEDPDANPTVSSASPGTDRLDDDWAETARDYLRALVLAGEFERESATE